MKFRLRVLVAAGAAISLLAATQSARAQSEVGYQLRYSSGQGVQPIFEGWSRNADGSFTMHFGYLNRNYVEEVHVPVGPQNNIEPGGPDRGQPTYFYPRINRRMFRVVVPKDFGKKELIWTMTFRGSTTRAVGWLQPEWEVDSSGGTGRPSGSANKPPTLTVEPSHSVTLPNTLTLSPAVADDGLPKPGTRTTRKQAVGQETPPILQPTEDTPEAPVNVPQIRLNPRGGMIPPRAPQGLSVAYSVWRGPAAVKTDPMFAVAKDGKATTTLTFTQPGEYVLRVRATDGVLSAQQDIKVTVVAASSK
jgi:hypothetical protein